MKKIYSRLMLAVFVFLPLVRVAASEVTLKNGDRISGTIVEQSAEAIVVETEFAGTIRIERKYVERISLPEASTAEVVEPSPESRGPNAPETAESPSTTEVKKPENEKTENAEVAAKTPARLFAGGFTGLAEGWEGNANVGFSFTSGNSNNATMTTSLRAVKSGVNENLTVYVRSLWNTNRGNGKMVTTQNAFWGGARYDRTIDNKLFAFASYDFERDRPNKLNFRSVVGGGLGHHTLKNERTEVDLLLGAAWNRTWTPGDKTDSPEALVGSTLKHKFHDRLRFQKTFTYFQNATDISERRFLFDATISADVTKRVGFFITVGDRFNNDPIGSAKKNDFLFTTGMKWNFGKKK